MNPISIAHYRARAAHAVIRERSDALRLPGSVFFAEGFAGELVLADLATAGAEPHSVRTLIARYFAVRALHASGPTAPLEHAEAEAWSAELGRPRELLALRAARCAGSASAARYRALTRAADEAAALGHHGSAFALRCLAHQTACQANRRRAAARAAAAAARHAASAGAKATARRWARRAARLRRPEQDS